MFTFLEKLSQLKTVSDVILISENGDPLFVYPAAEEAGVTKKIQYIQRVTKSQKAANFIELHFSQCIHLLCETGIGYIFLCLKDRTSLSRIKPACKNVQTKLREPSARKRILLKMLNEVTTEHQPNILKALCIYADEEVVSALQPFTSIFPQLLEQGAVDLLSALLEVYGNSSSTAALDSLRKLQKESEFKSGPEDAILDQSLQIAVKQLEFDLGSENISAAAIVSENVKQQKKPVSVERGASGASPAAGNAADTPEDQHFAILRQKNDTRAAVEFVVQKIENSIQQSNFREAEEWRDKLIRVDSMAIHEIIRTAELIEEAKASAIDDTFLETWKDLSLRLSRDEFTSLYHVMEHRDHKKGDRIAEQGKFNSNLYFVNRGKIQIITASDGRNIPLTIIEEGQILGAEHFFEGSVWTVNAESLGAEVSTLSMTQLQSLKDNCPALQSKLMEHCSRFTSLNVLFSRTHKNRRKFARQTVHGRVTVEFEDAVTSDLGTGTKGDLLDVSEGGISFSLHFSKRKYALALLAKKIKLTVRPDRSQSSFQCAGKIMAVRCHDFVGNEYSLHVEFHEPLQRAELLKNFPSA